MPRKTKECPFCAETIKTEAVICRYCGRDLPIVEKVEETQKVEAKEQIPIISEVVPIQSNPSETNKDVKILIGLAIACLAILTFYYFILTKPPSQQVFATPTVIENVVITQPTQIVLEQTQDNERQKLINEVIALFEKGTNDAYVEAYDTKLRLVRGANDKYWNDEEIQALADYALGMADVTKGNLNSSDFAGISPDYNGVYHQQMSSEILKHISRSDWVSRYEEWSTVNATVVARLRKPIPAIGMTAQQVIDSQWGRPKDINKTITAGTTFEQWVYSDNRYVYLENGIVTSIQE